MTKFKSARDMKQVKLLGFWNPNKDLRYDGEGKVSGVYVDWQVDQSHLTADDIKAGKYDRDPHLISEPSKDGFGINHKCYYDIDEMETILGMYKHGRYFHLDKTYPNDIIVGTGIVADVTTDMFDHKGQLIPILPKSEEYNPYSYDPDNDRASAIEHNMEHPCGVSPSCTNDGRVTQDAMDKQLYQIDMAIKFFENELDRKDRLRDVDYNKTHVNTKYGIPFPDIPIYARRSQLEIDEIIAKDKKQICDAISHTIERDGRLQSIDYDLISDRNAFVNECKNHDGILKVYMPRGQISMEARDYGERTIDKQYADPKQPILPDFGFQRAMGVEYVWYDNMKRQLSLEKEAALRGEEYHVPKIESNFDFDPVRVNDVHLKPHSAAKAFRDQKFAQNVPLIAMWSKDDLTYGPGEHEWIPRVTGAYVDVQVDQSKLNITDIENGKGYSNPSVNCSSHKRDDVSMNKVWYSKKQLAAMRAAGTSVDNLESGDKCYCSFTANLMSHDTRSGQRSTVVLLPKTVTPEMNSAERASVELYNRTNPVKQSQYGKGFTMAEVMKQFEVTHKICDLTDFPSKQQVVENEQSQEKSMDLSAGVEFM